MCDGDGDQLLGLGGKRPFRKYGLAECPKGLRRLWYQVLSPFSKSEAAPEIIAALA